MISPVPRESKPIALASPTSQPNRPTQPNQPDQPNQPPRHPATQPPCQPAHPRLLPSVTAERGGEVFLTSENPKTSPPGDQRDSGEGANRTVLCRAGKRAVYPKDGFGPQVQYCRHFFTLHRAPFLNGKAPILETVVTFEAPRVAS